jgi:16S rRNA (uracil1498-N3)-methyltransferase
MNIFYQLDIEQTLTLGPEESAHCAQVLRMKAGERAKATDGRGHFYLIELADVNKKSTRVKILEKRNVKPRPYQVHIGIAPTKNIDRVEYFIEKAVEIGIEEISFLKCEHSERKEVKLERLEKIAVAAMKQSQKAFMPVLNDVVKYTDFIKKNKLSAESYIAYLDKENSKDLVQQLQRGKDAIILIGPEGDFSPAEVNLAREAGYKPARLGESRLRTETAGIVAVHTVHLVNMI